MQIRKQVLQAGEFKLKPGVDVVPYAELKELRLEDGLDVSRKVRRAGCMHMSVCRLPSVSRMQM
jgi:hypothetical protein